MKLYGKVGSYFIGIVSIIFFVIGIIDSEVSTIMLATLFFWSATLLNAVSSENRNNIYIFFLITFFIFLLSRAFIRLITTGEVYAIFDTEVMKVVYTCILLSLIGLWIGSSIKKRFVFGKRNSVTKIDGENIDYQALARIALFFVFVSGLSTILLNVEKLAYWKVLGSGSLETTFSSSLPSFLKNIAGCFPICFSIFLATLPSKKKAYMAFGIYLINSVVRMMYGSRSDFILGLMFIWIYFSIRDTVQMNYYLDDENYVPWLSRGMKWFSVLCIPFVIILTVFIGYYRLGATFQFSGFADSFIEFFDKQGGSSDIIGYTYIYGDKLTQPKFLYLFDNTYTFLTTNPIASIFTGKTNYPINTVERAIYGTSLEQSLYYIIDSGSYLRGNGAGTSYIAEAFLGYGYLGVLVVNIVLSYILKRIELFSSNRFWKNVLILVFLQAVFFIPRSGFDDFVDDFASTTKILVMVLIYFVYRIRLRRR